MRRLRSSLYTDLRIDREPAEMERAAAPMGSIFGTAHMPTLAKGIDLDAIDQTLIAELQRDGRSAFVDLARKVGLSEKTTRARISSLLERNVIRIVALTSPYALGLHAIAFLGLRTDPSVAASQIARKIAAIEDVDYVVVTTGRYSIIVEVLSADVDAMRTTIEERIGSTAGVQMMEIFPCFSLFYQKARFLAPVMGGTGVLVGSLSECDRQIALALSADGRIPYRILAEKIGVSETYVRIRVAAMIESGQMAILAITNPLAFKDRCVAWVAVKVAMGSQSEELAEILSHEECVSYVFICGGRFDLFIELICDSAQHLHDVLEKRIRALQQIQSFETFVYLDLHYKVLGT